MATAATPATASAAYWTACQAGEVYCAPGGEVGSIGVYTMFANIAESMKQDGIAVELISAGKFKTEGNPYGALSDEARAHIQSTVDAYYDSFVRAVARGRGVALKTVRESMGQGRLLQADAAKAEKMIDGVATLDQVIARMQTRAAGRDKSAAGMRAYVAAQMRENVAATSSSPAQALTRDAMEREVEILKLT